MKRFINKLCQGFGVFLASLLAAINAGHAAELSLTDVPLFISGSEVPNVFFMMDDSGSMDWEILTKKYWEACAYDSGLSSSNCDTERTNGRWRGYTDNGRAYFEYLFDNDDIAYSENCTSTGSTAYGTTAELCTNSAVAKDWRVISSSFNVMFYDPKVQYKPWTNSGLLQATFTDVRSHPKSTEDGYDDTKDLANDPNLLGGTGFVYEEWEGVDGTPHGDKGWTGTYPNHGTTFSASANGLVDLWDNHRRFTVTATSVLIENITYAPDATGMNPTITTLKNVSGLTTTDPLLGQNQDGSDRSVEDVQKNIANWYQYSRKRSFVAKAAVAEVLAANPNYRYGISFLNTSATFIEVPDLSTKSFADQNEDVLEAIMQLNQPNDGTPLRRGLERVGKYYDNVDGKTDPIISECQTNFSILMTDGYWNGGDPASGIGDADGDGNSLTLADVAKYYYDEDLSALDDEVPVSKANNDLATHQHMVTFTVAFGVEGLLTDGNDADEWPDITGLSESSDWGNPIGMGDEAGEKIDDLWHAAYNSRGKYISADTPTKVVTGINSALQNIKDRTASAAALAANATTIDTGVALFQSQFNSTDWSGNLRSLEVSNGPIPIYDGMGKIVGYSPSCQDGTDVPRGFVCPTPLWNAQAQLDGQSFDTGRTILSYNPTQKGIKFDAPSDYTTPTTGEMDTTQIAALLTDAPATGKQAYLEDLVDYLRGDSSNEGSGVGDFRQRSHKLGDMINSAPIYVGVPRFRYPDTIEANPYSTFKGTTPARTAMVYVGANDGMLHGFIAEGTDAGKEKLAYVPSKVYSNLHKLADPNYTHKFFVDGTPAAGDVYFPTGTKIGWRTVLVGGLNAGGQGVYALDVTDPSAFNETNPQNTVLWEFTDVNPVSGTNPDGTAGSEGDADIGYIFGTPDIVKTNEGRWVAIFGNGYNNTQSDGRASGTGTAALYIVDIQTGKLIKKIDTKIGSVSSPNGLGTPTPVDTNGDYLVDYVYAGDLQGNIWKFDLKSSTINGWRSYIRKTNSPNSDPEPFFTTQSGQPITTRPTVTKHPDKSKDGYMVYFGTGKYIETTDNSTTGQTTQSFYGVWDDDVERTAAVPRSSLVQQSITEEVERGFDFDSDGNDDLVRDLRITTDHPVDWSIKKGWYMNLVNTEGGNTDNEGERQVTDPIVRNGRIIFTTLLPNDSTCDFGGSSWVMELDAETGGPLDVPPFDLNNDGVIDEYDMAILSNNSEVIPGGTKFEGIVTMPRILGGGDLDFKQFGSSASEAVETLGESSGGNLGRTGWRQIVR